MPRPDPVQPHVLGDGQERGSSTRACQTTAERDPTYAADVTMCASAACFDCERADIVVGAFVQANRLLGDHTGGRVLREGRPAPGRSATNGRALVVAHAHARAIRAQRRPEGREAAALNLPTTALRGSTATCASGRARTRSTASTASRRRSSACCSPAVAVRLLLRVPPARAEARLQFAAGLGPRPRRQGRDPRDAPRRLTRVWAAHLLAH